MDIYLARQPIFDQRRRVFAYELLFRSGPENFFTPQEPDMPSAHVISTSLLGVGALTDGKIGFMSFSRETLLSDFAYALSPEEIVIELLESVTADAEVLDACHRLKQAGYRIALDDFVDREETRDLLEVADFIKVDVLATSQQERMRLASKLGPSRLLAEKVETWEMFGEVAKGGYRYFQGFFFSRPVMVSAKAIPGFRLNYVRLLEELNRPSTSVDRLEDIIKREASIAYRLLRRVNSLAMGFRTEVYSVRHALVLLGATEIRRMATVWVLAEIGQESPAELVAASTLRAKMCELLVPPGQPDVASEVFLVGLFSMLDAIMEYPMEKVLSHLPVTQEVRGALLGETNTLRTYLECAMAYERGGWEQAQEFARRLSLQEDEVAHAYLKALKWVGDIFKQES